MLGMYFIGGFIFFSKNTDTMFDVFIERLADGICCPVLASKLLVELLVE